MCNKRGNAGGLEDKAATRVFKYTGHMVFDTSFDDTCRRCCGGITVLNFVLILLSEVRETKYVGP